MRELADALDHTDLQNVRVYFDIKSDIVESLDKSMALALGPVAQAFLGKLVRSDGEAERGGDPASQVAVQDSITGEAFGLGTDERIAGFLHVGSSEAKPADRERPDMAAITRRF